MPAAPARLGRGAAAVRSTSQSIQRWRLAWRGGSARRTGSPWSWRWPADRRSQMAPRHHVHRLCLGSAAAGAVDQVDSLVPFHRHLWRIGRDIRLRSLVAAYQVKSGHCWRGCSRGSRLACDGALGPKPSRSPHARSASSSRISGSRTSGGPASKTRRIGLEALTIKSAQKPRLIFWPEAAVTNPLVDGRLAAEQQTDAERLRASLALGSGDLLLTGGLGVTSSDGQPSTAPPTASSSATAARPYRRPLRQGHLVPYGEYLPMRPLLSAISLSRLAPGDLDFALSRAARVNCPASGQGRLQLCCEIIFSGEVVDRANRPDFIFNPSNDACSAAGARRNTSLRPGCGPPRRACR